MKQIMRSKYHEIGLVILATKLIANSNHMVEVIYNVFLYSFRFLSKEMPPD